MAGIELVKDKKTKEPYALGDKMGVRVCAEARKNGVIIRPLGNVIVLMPPLTISGNELKSLTRVTGEAVKTVTG